MLMERKLLYRYYQTWASLFCHPANEIRPYVIFKHDAPPECPGPVYVPYFDFEIFFVISFPLLPLTHPHQNRDLHQNLVLFARQGPGGREGTGERETPPGSEVVDGAAAASPGQPTAVAPSRRRAARTRRRAGSKLVDGAAAASPSYPPRPPPLAHAVTSPAAPTRPRSLVSRLRHRRRAFSRDER